MKAATECEMPQGLHCNVTSTVAGAPLSLRRRRCARFRGSCWQCAAAAAQEMIGVHLSASPRSARMSPFMLSTKAFCFAI